MNMTLTLYELAPAHGRVRVHHPPHDGFVLAHDRALIAQQHQRALHTLSRDARNESFCALIGHWQYRTLHINHTTHTTHTTLKIVDCSIAAPTHLHHHWLQLHGWDAGGLARGRLEEC
jgi:hypothetical protein